MKFATHSPDDLFSAFLRSYCEEKLQRPIFKHQLDDPAAALSIEATQKGEVAEMRVKVSLPGQTPITITSEHEDAYAAIDLAADKLERKIRNIEQRKVTLRRRRSSELGEALKTGDEDFFTEGEEEVLRNMGALDAVIES